MSKKKKSIPDSNKESLNRQKNIFANFKWSYVINFLITLIGVFGGVYLSNLYFQSSKNESTINKFNLLYTECYQNFSIGQLIYLQLNDTSRTDYAFQLLYVGISNSLLQDNNFYSVGSAELYDLILNNASLTSELNKRLELYSKAFQYDQSRFENLGLLYNISRSIAYNARIRQRLRDKNLVRQVITEIHEQNMQDHQAIVKIILDGEYEYFYKDSILTTPTSWKEIRTIDPIFE